jgi:hypothetical protein
MTRLQLSFKMVQQGISKIKETVLWQERLKYILQVLKELKVSVEMKKRFLEAVYIGNVFISLTHRK